MIRLRLAGIVAGVVLVVLGVKELRLSMGAAATPHDMTCAELAATGPGDNAHVAMGEFLLCTHGFVYEAENDYGPWQTVWVPAVPLGGEYHLQLLRIEEEQGRLPNRLPMPRDVRVIVKSKHVLTDMDLMHLADSEVIQGTVVNTVESLGKDERRLLAETYPGFNAGNCWILEHGRKPATAGKVAGFMGGGAALTLAILATFVKRQKPVAAPVGTVDELAQPAKNDLDTPFRHDE